ncbi:MAG TPA: flagellar hook protein FlgE [Acidimicrobiia bacterium]
MLRSMYAAVSGLQTNQLMMDVVGNNIANVNTIGYKSSDAVFADVLSQTLNGAGLGELGISGGSNPSQVGLGVRLQTIETSFAQGATQLTGNSTDMAIQGDGMFVVNMAGTQAYTRAGSFTLDAQGQLVTPDGGLVEGWQGVNGAVNTNASISSIRIPVGQQIPATATTTVRMSGNLPADSSDGSGTTPATVIDASIDVYNTLGTAVPLRVEYTKVPNSTGTVDWSVSAYDPDGNKISGPLTLQFDQATGEIKTPASRTLNLTAAQLGAIKVNGQSVAGTWNGGGINLSFGQSTDADRVTGSAGTNDIAASSQDGSPIGSLVSYSVSPEGLVSGIFSNGKNEQLAQIAMANFTNPAGLTKLGGSLYTSTVNSGTPLIGTAGSGGRGTLSGGAVEQSNVDLATEFTNLIVAQRGFQANARIITASDEILQDLVNMKQ